MSNLPLQYREFSVFSFQGQDRLFVESIGQDFQASINGFLEELRKENKPLQVALDLSTLSTRFLRSQELGRQIDRVVMEGRKHPEKKVDFVIVGSEFFRELNGMATITCKRFPLVDFEPMPPVGF